MRNTRRSDMHCIKESIVKDLSREKTKRFLSRHKRYDPQLARTEAEARLASRIQSINVRAIHRWSRDLQAGKVYDMTSDLYTEVATARATLETLNPAVIEYPSPSGILFIPEGAIQAITWQTFDSDDLTFHRITAWQKKDVTKGRKGFIPNQAANLWTAMTPIAERYYAFGEGISATETADHVMVLYTFCLFMSQDELVETKEQPTQIASSKGAKRVAGSQKFTVVSLRNYPHRETSQPPALHGRRTTDKRWVVSGHWRKQWYPKAQAHKPRWIPAHVKGPEGAPLTNPEKVYVLAAGRAAHE